MDVHRRRSIRLKGYDYSSAGAYFVTICTSNKQCFFGEIGDGEMHLNDFGQLVYGEWLKTHTIRPQVCLDQFIIMPNHLHGIVVIAGAVGAYGNTPRQEQPTQAGGRLHSPAQNIVAIVRGFKAATTGGINLLRQTPGANVWQRNYYERVIRNEDELNRARKYIRNNPGNGTWTRKTRPAPVGAYCIRPN